MPATATRTRSTKRAKSGTGGQLRVLLERISFDGAKLEIDEENKVIKGVRVLGNLSRNCHGVRGVTEGSEYTRDLMKKAIEKKLYEGRLVNCDHPEDQDNPKVRPKKWTVSVTNPLGVLRNVRFEDNPPCLRADLHYQPDHPMANRVLEDVRRGLGMYGLSHNACVAKDKVVGKRYVIEELASVRSVDLVIDPATNKNLWEDAMDDTAMSDSDPIADGIRQAVTAVLDDDTLDADAKIGKIRELLKTHEKITADPEDTTPSDDSGTAAKESDDMDDKKKADYESLEAKYLELQRKDAVRTLCESMSFAPSAAQMKALLALADADRKEFIEEVQTAAKITKPKSSAPGIKPVLESTKPTTAKEFARMITI